MADPTQTPPLDATPPAVVPDPAVSGGPGGAPAPSPELRTVKISGREVQVPPDVAEAIAARELEYARDFTKQGDELGALRAQSREWAAERDRMRAAVVGPSAPAEPDTATLLFTDPAKALEQHEQRILNRIETQRRVESDRDQFWARFYGDHPDLTREDHWLVEAVLQRNFRDLATLPVADGQKKLGDLTRQAVLSLIQKRAPASNGSPRTVVEGASGGRPERAAAPAEENGAKSLSDVINARKRARRAPVRAAS